MSKPCFTPLDVLNVINGSIGHILESKKSNEDTKSSEALSRAVEVFESIDVEAEFSGLFLDARETVPKVKRILKNLVDLERKEKNIAAADKSQTQTTKEEKETADSADSHILEEELNGKSVSWFDARTLIRLDYITFIKLFPQPCHASTNMKIYYNFFYISVIQRYSGIASSQKRPLRQRNPASITPAPPEAAALHRHPQRRG